MTMMMVLAMALQAASAPAQPALLLGLEGDWVCRVAAASPLRHWRYENWRRDETGRLVGTIRVERTTRGHPVPVEEAMAAIAGHRLTYRSGGQLVRYRLLRSEGDEVIFESAGRARLRRIAFRRDGRFLRVMHIYRDGRSDSWTYQRSGARNAPPYCSGSYRR